MSNEENNIKFGEFPTTNIQDVDLPTAIEMAKNKVMSTLNCHNIGKIVEFNTQNQTATVEVVAQKQYNGNTYGLPLLLEVPCFIYGGNNQYITMGNLVGSYCLLVFMDRNIDNFMLTGSAYVPATGRMHDWSDCVALCGFNPLTNVIEDYNNQAIEIRNKQVTTTETQTVQDNSTIGNYSDYIEIRSGNTTEAGGEITSIFSNLNVNPDSILLENAGGAEIEIDDKITIKNTAQNLATLIQNFLTACENIAVDTQTGIITPTSKQVFTDLKTQFQALLNDGSEA